MSDDVQVIYVDGILDVQNLGPNFATTYFMFERALEGCQMLRAPIVRLVRPKRSILKPDGIIAQMLALQADPCRELRLHS